MSLFLNSLFNTRGPIFTNSSVFLTLRTILDNTTKSNKQSSSPLTQAPIDQNNSKRDINYLRHSSRTLRLVRITTRTRKMMSSHTSRTLKISSRRHARHFNTILTQRSRTMLLHSLRNSILSRQRLRLSILRITRHSLLLSHTRPNSITMRAVSKRSRRFYIRFNRLILRQHRHRRLTNTRQHRINQITRRSSPAALMISQGISIALNNSYNRIEYKVTSPQRPHHRGLNRYINARMEIPSRLLISLLNLIQRSQRIPRGAVSTSVSRGPYFFNNVVRKSIPYSRTESAAFTRSQRVE